MLSLRTYVKKSFTSSLCILLAKLDIFSLHNNFILLLKVKHRDLSSFFSAAHITAAPHASTRSNNSQNISKLTTAPHKSYLLKLLAAFRLFVRMKKVSLQHIQQLRQRRRTSITVGIIVGQQSQQQRFTLSIYLSLLLLYSKLPRQEERCSSISD